MLTYPLANHRLHHYLSSDSSVASNEDNPVDVTSSGGMNAPTPNPRDFRGDWGDGRNIYHVDTLEPADFLGDYWNEVFEDVFEDDSSYDGDGSACDPEDSGDYEQDFR